MPGDRLTGLDASFLHLEDASAHMHVASVMVFEGDPPPYEELLESIEGRLHLVPRYRQRLGFVPLGQGRPRWVDDPHLNLRYHVRATALPAPGGEDQLRALASRVFAQQLDRDKPLWEIYLVEGLDRGRFALLAKTHHALVDGVSGVDIFSVLFDTSADPAAPPDPGRRWLPAPAPSSAQLLGEALLERATVPGELVRSVRALFRGPRKVADSVGRAAVRRRCDGLGRAQPGAAQPLQPHDRPPPALHLGAHRAGRHQGDQERARRHGERRGAGHRGRRAGPPPAPPRAAEPMASSSRRWCRSACAPTTERGELGNKVAAMMAPLPVWCQEPEARLEIVREQMADLKDSGQALGAQVLTDLTGFAPPTVMARPRG